MFWFALPTAKQIRATLKHLPVKHYTGQKKRRLKAF